MKVVFGSVLEAQTYGVCELEYGFRRITSPMPRCFLRSRNHGDTIINIELLPANPRLLVVSACGGGGTKFQQSGTPCRADLVLEVSVAGKYVDG